MKKCLLYSIVIYLFLIMILQLYKPSVTNIKSFNYIKHKLENKIYDIDDLYSEPFIVIVLGLLSFIIARNIDQE